MKLEGFQHTGFDFSLMFINSEVLTVDLYPLIGAYISADELLSARIDSEWGCLEFRDGLVDIDPTTLYRYAVQYGASKQHREPLPDMSH